MKHSKVFVFTANLDYDKQSFCFAKFQPNRREGKQRAGLAGETDVPTPTASIFNQHIFVPSEEYPLTLIFFFAFKIRTKKSKSGRNWKCERVQE